eukprot:scaffold12190_cov120-Isochrysis_galbana.AAC.4
MYESPLASVSSLVKSGENWNVSSLLMSASGCLIGTATHGLIQAYLDETEEEGLILALDWEKAFDRASWDYYHQALEALNFGPHFITLATMLSNPHSTPKRRVQGLTRLFEDCPEIEGVDINGTTIKISQFADDTQIIVKGYKAIHGLIPGTGPRPCLPPYAVLTLLAAALAATPLGSHALPVVPPQPFVPTAIPSLAQADGGSGKDEDEPSSTTRLAVSSPSTSTALIGTATSGLTHGAGPHPFLHPKAGSPPHTSPSRWARPRATPVAYAATLGITPLSALPLPPFSHRICL